MTPKPTCVLFSSPVGHVGSVVVPNIRCISETKSGDISVQKFRAAILIVDGEAGCDSYDMIVNNARALIPILDLSVTGHTFSVSCPRLLLPEMSLETVSGDVWSPYPNTSEQNAELCFSVPRSSSVERCPLRQSQEICAPKCCPRVPGFHVPHRAHIFYIYILYTFHKSGYSGRSL